MLAWTAGDKIMKTTVPWVPYGQLQARCHSAPRAQRTQSCSSSLNGNTKTPQYRPALRSRVGGKFRSRCFEAMPQVNTYAMSKRAGSCLQRNVFILSLKHSPALASQFGSSISQVCKLRDALCNWCFLLRRQLSSHANLFSLTSLKITLSGTR